MVRVTEMFVTLYSVTLWCHFMVPLYSVTETIHEGVKYVYTIKPTLLTIEETQTEV